MAAAKPTAQKMLLQPRPGADGTAAAYLAWWLNGKLRESESGCWEWAGQSMKAGYGRIDLKNYPDWPQSVVLVHRVVYQLCVGPVPDGMVVCHRCDNPPCCRPDHLFLGTNSDNIADKISKGRQAAGQSVRKNHEHLRGEVIVTAKLTAEQVMEIRRREAAGEHPDSIAADHGTSRDYVVAIARGDCWTHLPLVYTGDRKNRPCPKCGVSHPTRAGIFYRHVADCQGDLLLGKE